MREIVFSSKEFQLYCYSSCLKLFATKCCLGYVPLSAVANVVEIFNIFSSFYYLTSNVLHVYNHSLHLQHSGNMAKERGVFKILWNSFVSSLKPRYARRKLIGEDYYGTKYYEEEIRYSARKRPPRYFVPVNKDDFEQELPAEWEAWLRYRRKDPPTREEIETNYQLAITKKENATKLLEENYSRNEDTKDLPVSTPTQATTPGNFPVYKDFQNFGSNYKPKDSYK